MDSISQACRFRSKALHLNAGRWSFNPPVSLLRASCCIGILADMPRHKNVPIVAVNFALCTADEVSTEARYHIFDVIYVFKSITF